MSVSVKKRSVEIESPLETPRFDSRAAANAQPVQPIPSGVHGWIEKGKSVREMITTRARALSLIIIAGLATGTVGGILMVNDRHSNVTRVSSLSNTERTNLLGVESGAYGFLMNRNPVVRARKARQHTRSASAPRAYRVGVIRY